MEISEVIGIALPVVYVLVGAAVIWLAIELVMTVRKTRKTVDEVQKQIEPTLAHVERITASLEPVAAKVDPLVERVSLTVDAANLEIMRIDQILEDVNEITDSVSSAVDAVDTVANAPMELVNNVTSRVRKALKPRRASEESVALGREKADESSLSSNFKTAVKDSAKVAGEVVSDQRAYMADQKAERDEKAAAKRAAAEKTAEAAASMTDAVATAATSGAETASQYFSYESAQKPETENDKPSSQEDSLEHASNASQAGEPLSSGSNR